MDIMYHSTFTPHASEYPPAGSKVEVDWYGVSQWAKSLPDGTTTTGEDRFPVKWDATVESVTPTHDGAFTEIVVTFDTKEFEPSFQLLFICWYPENFPAWTLRDNPSATSETNG
jgi:hypothetical protein